MKRKTAQPKKNQRNLADTQPEDLKDSNGKSHFIGASPSELSEAEIFPEIRQPVTITTWIPGKSGRWLRTKKVKNYSYSQVIGAAGPSNPELIPDMNLKEVSDPLTSDIRKDLTNILLSDPVAAPAGRYSVGAVFEDGFDLKLTLASQFDPSTKRQLTEDQINMMLEAHRGTYDTYLEQLATWKDDCDLEQLVKDLHGVSLAQGKACGMIQPGILELQQGKLPQLCQIVPAEDLSNPIIDAGLTRKIVAVKLDLSEEELKDPKVKDILRADEIVYYVTGLRGLRREAPYHGVPPLEPVLQISKALKRYYHLDAPLAMVSAYITKQLIKVSKENIDDALQTRVTTFMSNLFKSTTWAMAMPDWYDGVDTVTPKVDWPMFDGVENKLATVELSAMGVPKSAMNREQDLNRDIATIQAIQFVRFIRKPAEEALKKVIENQILNQLFAHLVGKKLNEIPVRVEIVRKTPKEGDITEIFDSLSQEKNNDMNTGNLLQNQPQNPIGASGDKELNVLRKKAYRKVIESLE